jgi:hypothetical protein
VRIQKRDSEWVVGTADPLAGRLRHATKKMAFNFSSQKLDLSSVAPHAVKDVAKIIDDFAVEAEDLHAIVVNSLAVPNTTRAGARFWFSAPADTLEDADRLLCRAATSPLLDALVADGIGTLRDTAFAYVFDASQSGLKRRVELASEVVQQAGKPAYDGLTSDGFTGFVSVNLDNYTRPTSGHLPEIRAFINNNYMASHRIAMKTFQWLIHRQ